MDELTPEKIRALTPADLGIESPVTVSLAVNSDFTLPPLPDDDELLVQVNYALNMNFSGIIFCGPPGTGKTWNAKRIAQKLAGDPARIQTVQFHPSYQYEDFMEGYVPRPDSGFVLEQKTFPTICGDASKSPDAQHVLVIEEISRCDVARVFGEALTYIEVDKRGWPFTLASGNKLVVPRNLVILATMNPWDKGVDELDVALERRFAQIDMPPNAEALRTMLRENGAEPEFIDRIVAFFDGVQALEDDMCHLGHAYFRDCTNLSNAQQVWNFRLHPFFRRACRLDTSTLSSIEEMWQRDVLRLDRESGGDLSGADSSSPPADDPGDI